MIFIGYILVVRLCEFSDFLKDFVVIKQNLLWNLSFSILNEDGVVYYYQYLVISEIYFSVVK